MSRKDPSSGNRSCRQTLLDGCLILLDAYRPLEHTFRSPTTPLKRLQLRASICNLRLQNAKESVVAVCSRQYRYKAFLFFGLVYTQTCHL